MAACAPCGPRHADRNTTPAMPKPYGAASNRHPRWAPTVRDARDRQGGSGSTARRHASAPPATGQHPPERAAAPHPRANPDDENWSAAGSRACAVVRLSALRQEGNVDDLTGPNLLGAAGNDDQAVRL